MGGQMPTKTTNEPFLHWSRKRRQYQHYHDGERRHQSLPVIAQSAANQSTQWFGKLHEKYGDLSTSDLLYTLLK